MVLNSLITTSFFLASDFTCTSRHPSTLQSPMRISFLLWLSFLFCYYWACLSFNVSLVSGDSVHCLDRQKFLLLKLKENLKSNYRDSNKLVSWDESFPCSEWSGVTWDEEGHVTGLDISGESISGELDNSSTLFSLQYLKHLNLAFNNFSSVIPSRIRNLKNLTSLNLSTAGFMEQIPMEIGQLTRLTILDLSTSYLVGGPALTLENPNLVKLVQNLGEVRELYLDGIDILLDGNGWGPALSSFLPHLQVLSMSGCSLSGPIDPSLEILQNLSIIRLGHNFLSAPVPDFFAKFSNLIQLNLSSCDLSGTFPNKIFQLQSLTCLDLSDNFHLQGSLPDFPQNGSLLTLNLSYTSFSGALPDSISNLRQLSILDIYGCPFDGTLPDSMSNLTELTYLDLSWNSFTGPIPPFGMAKKLTHLYMSHNSFTGPIPPFGMAKKLSIIDLSDNNLSGGVSSAHFKGLIKLVSIILQNNFLNGSVPMSLFSLPLLENIGLSNNYFQGQLDGISNVSSSILRFLDLSSNYLEGPIPQFIFHLKGLESLVLFSNKLNGTIQLDMFRRLDNLTTLYLSNNRLSIDVNVKNDYRLSFPNMTSLMLASCSLRHFPGFLRNLSELMELDLSNNEIEDKIPYWIWELGNLRYLNLSHNLLYEREKILYNFSPYSDLVVLDLHDNFLQGTLPSFPPYVFYLDYSYNKFSSIIPPDIGNYLSSIIFLSLSHNALYGRIPISICNALYLEVLDLSYNNFSGVIPNCLAQSDTLGVLNLGKNNFTGKIPYPFQASCTLQTLDLSSNNLQGSIPKSLSKCTTLEVFDIGNNKIGDEFPCFLKTIPTLRVMVLRRNNFYGPIVCPCMKRMIWKVLQIVDLAFNNFNGTLPGEFFLTWKAMMLDENQTTSKVNQIQFDFYKFIQVNYQDQVKVTMKGLEMNLTKILTVFMSIDLSSNRIEGSIPDEIMDFTVLHGLNLSNNNLSGHIPSSIWKMNQLESLDLSNNFLTGEIPSGLASLSFISFLNLSNNHLVGRIPTGTQLQSFDASSFKGNDGLYGPPLTQSQDNGTQGLKPPPQPPRTVSNHSVDFELIKCLEFGLVFGLGITIGPLFFWKMWRITYWKCVDYVLCSIFPQIYVDYQRHDGQWFTVLRWSH